MTKKNDGEPGVPLEGLADQPITRARAIKLAGAMLGTGAFALVAVGTAEARPNRRKRRRRARRLRRRRQDAVVSNNDSLIDFGDGITVGDLPLTREIEVANNSDVPVTVRRKLVDADGFRLVDASGTPIANGSTITIPANATRTIRVGLTDLLGGLQTGELRLVDADDGLLLETIDLEANGIL